MAAEIGERAGVAAALGKAERRCWPRRIEGGKLAERRILRRWQRDGSYWLVPPGNEHQRERRRGEDESENERGPEHLRRHGRRSPMSGASGKHAGAPANAAWGGR